ncbi:seven-hairpin glycosidase [Pseudovirgaria hyperparasitica]|uniref:alpha-1,2-Mannosidase n=1 Tax=Pseudovirgaria hyperparasitica TaxID=470096 RepID=A0A6A6W3L8_9PEZI|nr:seven-hairpin glycosidase [Pseudovirgaria hyperparasitica]KAF2757452.1 seven-hairpin glycosidase [Pseudovirgaria hyperparasitica]
MSRRLLRVRTLAVAALFLLILWFYFPFARDTGSESGRLAQYMNRASPRIKPLKSTIDWAAINFQFPVARTPAVPPVKPHTRLPHIQHAFDRESPDDAIKRNLRRDEVRKTFKKSWASYRQYAWMKDVLKPISGTSADQFCGWAATLVDSLDTLWIMGMREEFYEAAKAVARIDFGFSTSGRVNIFETNIRYLGGLLAAYDLSGHEALKFKAIEIGNLLYGGFNTENHMPVDFIDFETAKTGQGLEVEDYVVSASPGTLTMEFTRLSQITGDPKWYAAVAEVMEVFRDTQNTTLLPGMWPMFVSMRRKDMASNYQFSIGGNADSLFEYLPKQYQLLGGAEPKYMWMSRTFMDTAKKNLFFRPMTPDNADILLSGNIDVLDDGPHLDPESEHLSCFIGGLYALGGRLFENEDYIETGARLTRGCIWAYHAMPTGVMPERYNVIKCESRLNCKWDEAKWKEEIQQKKQYKDHLPKGFTTAKDPRYILRPEAIESVFVLYRITGRREFQDAAWEMFQAVRDVTSTQFAAAAIKDVTVPKDKVEREDYMESFWLAETLKYFYLVFSPPDLISLDEYVLNTEAHPFKRAR